MRRLRPRHQAQDCAVADQAEIAVQCKGGFSDRHRGAAQQHLLRSLGKSPISASSATRASTCRVWAARRAIGRNSLAKLSTCQRPRCDKAADPAHRDASRESPASPPACPRSAFARRWKLRWVWPAITASMPASAASAELAFSAPAALCLADARMRQRNHQIGPLPRKHRQQIPRRQGDIRDRWRGP